ncbi:hypothetical protein [Aureimonas pseudogalii]|uniref:Phage terminase Nu1 subunit (DNA packaging protein) n=1 Tax=Aureimonas pseudogalii TaxID=1744844 RepID=A0A7W6H5E1_9HYPH|nr:hypothetical protein [Aureimonas pseudogalii]MBB3998866.1 phage terminase Nu1 subunit (DNA packaging protein) [Aureimonas pseudogalii]
MTPTFAPDIEALLGGTPLPPPKKGPKLTLRKTDELNDARARAANATAAKAEMQTAKLAGELLEVAAVRAAWTDTAHAIRAGMLAIPGRLTGQGVDAATVRLVDAEVRAALEALSDG